MKRETEKTLEKRGQKTYIGMDAQPWGEKEAEKLKRKRKMKRKE